MTCKSKWMIVEGLLTALAQAAVPAVAQQNSPTLLSQKVLVVNGTGQPVPTAPQGTTKVDGTVNVGNTPHVTVANTPSVNVANTPTVMLESGASVNVTSPLDGQSNPRPLATLEAVQVYGITCGIGFSGSNRTGRRRPPPRRRRPANRSPTQRPAGVARSAGIS